MYRPREETLILNNLHKQSESTTLNNTDSIAYIMCCNVYDVCCSFFEVTELSVNTSMILCKYFHQNMYFSKNSPNIPIGNLMC